MTELAIEQTQPDAAINVRREHHGVWNLLHREFFLHREVANAQQLGLNPGDARPQVTVAILGDSRHEAEMRAAIQSVDAPELSVGVQRQPVVEADPEAPGPRWVPRPRVGDLVIVGGAGAYCASMSTINYNSYPQAPEVMLEPDGTLRLLRKRQSPEQMLANEV